MPPAHATPPAEPIGSSPGPPTGSSPGPPLTSSTSSLNGQAPGSPVGFTTGAVGTPVPSALGTGTAGPRSGVGDGPATPPGGRGAGALVEPGASPSGAPPADPARLFAGVVQAVRSVVHAEEATLRLAVGCLVAGGHLLIEDFPGLGKTTLAKTLARVLGLEFRRVQFTADLLPADVTGALVIPPGERAPVFRPGPVFTNLLMADELNRASARAQSALLEAMEEGQVTVDGHSMTLPRPFLVVATQNPYDGAGTSPLPHGQRDRFLARISLGYPGRSMEDALLAGTNPASVVGSLSPALDPGALGALMAAVAAVHVSPLARSYLLDIAAATRSHPAVRVGASPRAVLALRRLASAGAVADGRTYLLPEDIASAAVAGLAHRLLLEPGAEVEGTGPDAVVASIVGRVPVPTAPRAPTP